MSVRARIFLEKAEDLLPRLPADLFDSIVTDPPYGLEFMGKGWDSFKPSGARIRERVDGRTNPKNGKSVTRTPEAYIAGAAFQRWCEIWAAETFRVLKPGGYLVAFGGTRTYHRLACAIEDAGFEVRDSLHWMYGSGFPKGLDVSKAIGKAAGAQREVTGPSRRHNSRAFGAVTGDADYAGGAFAGGVPSLTAPATEDAARWQGWNVALKPAHEPIILARKPLSESTVAANVLRWGTGALNVDGCKVKHVSEADRAESEGKNPGRDDTVTSGVYGASRPQQSVSTEGRWPPNLLLTHCQFAWYALRHDVSADIQQTIRAYYGAGEGVREVRDGLLRDALGTGQAPVLLSGLRESGAARGPGAGVGDRGVQAVRGDVRDLPGVGSQRTAQVLLGTMPWAGAETQESGQDRQTSHGSRAGQDGHQSGSQGAVFPVEGRPVPGRRLLERDDRSAVSGNAGASPSDGQGRTAIHPGASGSGGYGDWPSAPQGRGSAPHQRGEAGQRSGESDRDTAGGSLAGAPRDREAVCDADGRGADAARGECVLAVPVGLIPEGWLIYFEYLAPGGCRQAGTRRVKTGSIKPAVFHRAAAENEGNTSAAYGKESRPEGHVSPVYTDPDGTETVQAFTCAPDCPVAGLDAQSAGTRAAKPSKTGSHGHTEGENNVYGAQAWGSPSPSYDDNGGASRFFPQFTWSPEYDLPFMYQAKAPKKERPRIVTDDGRVMRLRADLSDDERAYVLAELRKAGVDAA